MPYEVYFLPENSREPVFHTSLSAGERFGVASYKDEDIYGVSVNCHSDDSLAEIHINKVASSDLDHDTVLRIISDPDTCLERVTKDDQVRIHLQDKESRPFVMLVRDAGKTALNPKLN